MAEDEVTCVQVISMLVILITVINSSNSMRETLGKEKEKSDRKLICF